MAAPASSLSGASNHARLHRSICKKRCPQPIKTGKTEYWPRAETHTPPERWEFFTDDWFAVERERRHIADRLCTQLREIADRTEKYLNDDKLFRLSNLLPPAKLSKAQQVFL